MDKSMELLGISTQPSILLVMEKTCKTSVIAFYALGTGLRRTRIETPLRLKRYWAYCIKRLTWYMRRSIKVKIHPQYTQTSQMSPSTYSCSLLHALQSAPVI